MKPITSLITIFLMFSIVLILNGCVSESGKELQFYFYINETNEPLNGELIFNNISMGLITQGKISIPKDQLNISQFTLKTNYLNKNYSFDYDFLEGYLAYAKMNFNVPLRYFDENSGDAAKKTGLYFYEEKTNCSFNGEAAVDNIKIGEAKDGLLQLNYQEYARIINKNLCVYGKLGDCFKENKDFFFDYCWTPNSFTEEEFRHYSPLLFYAEFDEKSLRTPSEMAMRGFIRPDETKDVVKGLIYNPLDSQLEILGKLASLLDSKFTYLDDKIVYGEEEYWVTPAEFLEKREGDCEDWTNAFLSAILYYNSSLKCYNLLLSTHVTNFCYLGDFTYSFMDQAHVKLSDKLNGDGYMPEELKKFRELRNAYLDNYGISASQSAIISAYNDKEFIKFADNEDFVRWAIKFSYPSYNLP